MWSPSCVSVCVYPPLQILITWNESLPSVFVCACMCVCVCVCVCARARPFVVGQSLAQSESELLCNWQSVSQYVLVSSPIWDFWPEIISFFFFFFFWKVTVLSFGGALSDERSGLSFSIPPFIARQRLGNHVSLQWILATVEELLEVSLSLWSVSYRRRFYRSFCV
jgi:hypothetical protein